ncbi:MAG: penicillin-binding protein 2 [Chloroflexi bacterium]|nr:penicillin-binding protein 2 [Chloroflexota bacterium]
MYETLRRRLGCASFALAMVTSVIVCHLTFLFMGIDTPLFRVDRAYFTEQARIQYQERSTIRPPRGEIYDRNGVLLATNSIQYEIGVSPNLVYDLDYTAEALSEVIGISRDELLSEMNPPDGSTPLYLQLVSPAPASMGQAILALDLDGVVVTPQPRRFYPHEDLAAHILGFVSFEDVGYYGVEGYYDDDLRGQLTSDDQSRIPFEARGAGEWESGATLFLTISSEIQHLAEESLRQAIADTGATRGTILVMDPKTGEILAMANEPAFNPNRFYAQDESLFGNPAISNQYEPGSTFKILTMAIALENGVVQPDSTYNDQGVLEVGGFSVRNWDREAHGVTTMTDLLGQSLNVGAATLSLGLGPNRFYDGLAAFGIGERTGINLQGEARGEMRRPGNANWFESDLATNSYGQGIAVTPLQLVAAVSAVANAGRLMNPYIIAREERADGTSTQFEPTVIGRAISTETARDLSRMLATALEREASTALVPGYTFAGKTGTAQIPIPGSGYDEERTITSFIGYGPIDDPQFVVLIKLDSPTSSIWGSQTAAPAFNYFASRLVVLMEIPPDAVRLSINQ